MNELTYSALVAMSADQLHRYIGDRLHMNNYAEAKRAARALLERLSGGPGTAFFVAGFDPRPCFMTSRVFTTPALAQAYADSCAPDLLAFVVTPMSRGDE